MQSDRLLTRSDEHLAYARIVAPDEPDILFASACAVETLASRRVQNELAGVALPAGHTFERRPVRELEDRSDRIVPKGARCATLHGARPGCGWRACSAREAVTTRRSPSSGRRFGGRASPTLDYFAWLFTGDEELALGRREAATAAYERAAALVGDTASAPVVALARLAREYGDRAALAKALDRWWAQPADSLDPWSLYYFMQGGDVDARMDQLYALAGRRAR